MPVSAPLPVGSSISKFLLTQKIGTSGRDKCCPKPHVHSPLDSEEHWPEKSSFANLLLRGVQLHLATGPAQAFVLGMRRSPLLSSSQLICSQATHVLQQEEVSPSPEAKQKDRMEKLRSHIRERVGKLLLGSLPLSSCCAGQPETMG